MDESDYPSLPRLNTLHTRLAVQCRQVSSAVDRLLDPVEQLFRAATSEDWAAAQSAVSALTELPEDDANAPVIEAAVATQQAFRTDKPQAVRLQLSKLLAECRAQRHGR